MKKTLIGSSHDYRTNRWRIECDCGKSFEPRTTMLRFQEVECPKCGKTEVIDYNQDDAIQIAEKESKDEVHR